MSCVERAREHARINDGQQKVNRRAGTHALLMHKSVELNESNMFGQLRRARRR